MGLKQVPPHILVPVYLMHFLPNILFVMEANVIAVELRHALCVEKKTVNKNRISEQNLQKTFFFLYASNFFVHAGQVP